MKKKRLIALSLIISMLASGCTAPVGDAGGTDAGTGTAADGGTTDSGSMNAAPVSAFDLAVSDRDDDASYDENAVLIRFTDSGAAVIGAGALADGTSITVTEAGTYILSGSCKNGSVTVRAADTDKIQLVLDGLTLSRTDGAPLAIAEADKVFITLADGSQNALADGSSYEQLLESSSAVASSPS